MTKRKKLGEIHFGILDALKAHPSGIDIRGIRRYMEEHGTIEGIQQHLDRRLRELDPHYIIERKRQGRRTLYCLVERRPEGEWDYKKISKGLRAEILERSGYRCQMCGRTVGEDGIKLHIDHRIPRSWGGETEERNLWALCSVCNEGKQDYFASFSPDLMSEVLHYESVHERIARLLKLKEGQWVDSDLIEFVANFHDHQADWQKRLRELRYLGLEIEPRRRKVENRTVSSYRLTKWVELPEDPSRAAREYERERARQKRRKEL